MKNPTLQMTGPLPVAEIEDRNRLRPVSAAGVEALKTSIAETGVMKDAIHVRRKKGGTLVLIAGAHRLEAARQLGWETIEAKVWVDVTDDWSRLMEIDDNLAGAEMGPLDTAVFLAERKRVYEKLHPETRAATGAELVARRWNTADTMSVVSFAKVTAEKFGISERHVRRLVEAGQKLGVDSARLRSAPRPITLKDLIEISKVGEVSERYAIIDALRDGRAKSAAEARRAWAAKERGDETPAKDPVEEAFIALSKMWARAPKEARRRFVAAQFEELGTLGAEEEEARCEAERPALLAEIAGRKGGQE
jgi:ParB family chromosome partitioning protein